jgi:BASS family bile acid:Na+ symporter
MLSVGLAFSTRQILDPFRNRRGVFRTIVINFAIVPLIAFAIARALILDRALAEGLFLIGAAAGAPFLVNLTQLARGDVAFSATVLVLLVIVTIFYMPLVVPLAMPDAMVNAVEIGLSLTLTMLVPLALGHLIKAYLSSLATRLQPIMGMIARVSLVVLIAATFYLHLPAIFRIGTPAIVAAALLTGGAFVCGQFLINRRSQRRGVLGLGTAQRNIAAATVVAQTFADSDVLVMVVVTSLVGLAILFPIAWVLRKRSLRDESQERQDQETSEKIPRIA